MNTLGQPNWREFIRTNDPSPDGSDFTHDEMVEHLIETVVLPRHWCSQRTKKAGSLSTPGFIVSPLIKR